jgi:hypothetical protein
MLEANWVSVARASVALEMDEQQVYRLIREKKFPFRFIRLSRLIPVSAADLGLIDKPRKSEEQLQCESWQTAA